MNAKAWNITLVLVLLGTLLAGCGTAATAADTAESVAAVDNSAVAEYSRRSEQTVERVFERALEAA